MALPRVQLLALLTINGNERISCSTPHLGEIFAVSPGQTTLLTIYVIQVTGGASVKELAEVHNRVLKYELTST